MRSLCSEPLPVKSISLDNNGGKCFSKDMVCHLCFLIYFLDMFYDLDIKVNTQIFLK